MISYPVSSALVTFILVFSMVCNGYMLDNIQPKWFSSDRDGPADESDKRDSLNAEIMNLEKQIKAAEEEHRSIVQNFSSSVIMSQNEREPLDSQLVELENAMHEEREKYREFQTSIQDETIATKQEIDEAMVKKNEYKTKLFQCIANNNAKYRVPSLSNPSAPNDPSTIPSNTLDPLPGVKQGVQLPHESSDLASAVRFPNRSSIHPPSVRSPLIAQLPNDFSTTEPAPVQGVWDVPQIQFLTTASPPMAGGLGGFKPVPGVVTNNLHQRSIDPETPAQQNLSEEALECKTEKETITIFQAHITIATEEVNEIVSHSSKLKTQIQTMHGIVKRLSMEKYSLQSEVEKMKDTFSPRR